MTQWEANEQDTAPGKTPKDEAEDPVDLEEPTDEEVEEEASEERRGFKGRAARSGL